MTADLEQYVINGGLDFEAERVAGVLLAQHELVVDVEVRHGRDGRVLAGRHLVRLALLQHLLLQVVQLAPAAKRFCNHQSIILSVL